jgi:hypothetical protein
MRPTRRDRLVEASRTLLLLDLSNDLSNAAYDCFKEHQPVASQVAQDSADR